MLFCLNNQIILSEITSFLFKVLNFAYPWALPKKRNYLLKFFLFV
jgi:hypothetical protein